MIDLLYFASLKEVLGTAGEQMELPQDIHSINQLKSLLAERGGNWEHAFINNTSLLVSINQQMANDQSPIKSGDEIAFFPPVTGG